MTSRLKLLQPSWITAMITFLISFLSIQNYRGLPEKGDIIFATIHSPGPVILTQSVLLFLIAWQVVSFRKIHPLVAIRGMDGLIQQRLFKLITFEVFGYFILFDGTFLLTGHQIFQDGSLVIGILLLAFRVIFTWALGVLLITLYTSPHPGITLFAVLVANLLYHFIFEVLFLLIKYSQQYDPLWQAFHQQ